MSFECQRCGYKTEYTSNLKNHLRKKNICEPILQNISREKILKTYFDNHHC